MMKFVQILILCLAFYSCKDECPETRSSMGQWVYSSLNFLKGVGRNGGVNFEIEDSLYVGLGNVYNDFEGKSNSFWRYLKNDVYSGWDERADFPGKPRVGAVAFIIDKKAYVGLGKSMEKEKEYYKDFWVYDTEKNSWDSLLFEFPGDAVANAVAFSIGDTGYLGTGEKADGRCSDEFYMFSPQNGWAGAASMLLPRTGATVFKLNDTFYLAFGHNKAEDLRDVYRFDAKAFRFIPQKSLIYSEYPGLTRAYASSFVLNSGGQEYAYFVGGQLGNDVGEPYWFCCRYDYVKDLWEEVTPMPRSGLKVTTYVKDNTAFVFWDNVVLEFIPDK